MSIDSDSHVAEVLNASVGRPTVGVTRSSDVVKVILIRQYRFPDKDKAIVPFKSTTVWVTSGPVLKVAISLPSITVFAPTVGNPEHCEAGE